MHGGTEIFGWPWGSNNHTEDYTTYDNDIFEFMADKANLALRWKGTVMSE